MDDLSIIFYFLLIIVAFLYSSVGHGGATGYLALMSIYSFSPDLMRPTALVLNIFIAGVAFFQFYNKNSFNWKLFWSLSILSIPSAYLGGTISVEESIYKKILGMVLLIGILRILFTFRDQELQTPFHPIAAPVIGAVIGFLSGLIGIGGGIILTPLLLIFTWANIKESAAVSALFIVLNSIAGLTGNYQSTSVSMNSEVAVILAVALAGGILGSYFGAKKFDPKLLRIFLSIILMIASIKLFFI